MVIVNCKSISTSAKRDEMVDRYFSDIRKYKKLTHEEQRELLNKIKKGNGEESEKARKQLIEGNQRIVASVARKFARWHDFNDLVSEGTIGLNKAIDKFDLKYGQNFITYAIFWITKYIIDYIASYRNLITPKNANKVNTYVSSANNEFFLENCRYPTIEELQEILESKGVVLPNKDDLMENKIYPVSEISPEEITNEEIFPRAICDEFYQRTSSNNIEKEIDLEYFKHRVELLMSCLNEREKFIIKRYYGIECEAETFQMIANKLNVETRKVSSDFEKILKKIRKNIIFLEN